MRCSSVLAVVPLVAICGCYPFLWQPREAADPIAPFDRADGFTLARGWSQVWGNQIDDAPPYGERMLFESVARIGTGDFVGAGLFQAQGLGGIFEFDAYNEHVILEVVCLPGGVTEVGCDDGSADLQVSVSSSGTIGGPDGEGWVYVDYERSGDLFASRAGPRFLVDGQTRYDSLGIYQDGFQPAFVSGLDVVAYDALDLSRQGVPAGGCIRADGYALDGLEYGSSVCPSAGGPVDITLVYAGTEYPYIYDEAEQWISEGF